MSTITPVKRRERVAGEQNSNIYKRVNGTFEIGYRDSTGRQRWRTVSGGIMAARRARDEILGAKASGKHVQPNPGCASGRPPTGG